MYIVIHDNYWRLISPILHSSSLSLPEVPLTFDLASSSALKGYSKHLRVYLSLKEIFCRHFFSFQAVSCGRLETMGEMLGKGCGCGISLILVDCGFFFVEDSGCTDGEINVVVCDDDTEVIMALLRFCDCGEAGWCGNWILEMLVVGNWMCGSWGEKGTRQIPASIAVNLAFIADTKLKSRLAFLCRPSTQSFTVFTSLKRLMVWFYVCVSWTGFKTKPNSW